MARRTVQMMYKYSLEILDPNDGHDFNGDPAWQVLVFGTADSEDRTVGLRFSPECSDSSLSYELINRLYNIVSSSAVDAASQQIRDVVQDMHRHWRRSRS